MDHRHYHSPLNPASTRARCPVCHEAVYSRAGIHPQCAVRQSEPPKPKTKPVSPGVDDQAVEIPVPTKAEAVLLATHSGD